MAGPVAVAGEPEFDANQVPAADGAVADAAAFDVAVVGAGFAGMYLLHRVRQLGLSVRVFERGSDVGGTWYWNRYPGARCDVESLEYSYGFDPELQQEWKWSERYSAQPEVLAYANHVADRFDLRSDIEFDTTVAAARWQEDTSRWSIALDRADGTGSVSAQFLIMATGCLSSTNTPNLPGLDQFAGRVFHTGEWPHVPVDFSGRRVGVIGTGSSAIQAIPEIARQSRQLTVFQRTATYSVPARNEPLDALYEKRIKEDYKAFRAANRTQNSAFGAWSGHNLNPFADYQPEQQTELLEQGWAVGGFRFARSFSDMVINQATNDAAREFVVNKIQATVDDPETAALLSPTHLIGCKRLCLDSNYFETYNLNHVSLCDIKSNPIDTFTTSGVRLGDGSHVDLDDVVLATGFDAMTGTVLKIDLRGIGGVTLRERWSDGPRTYLGLAVPDFPNMFLITGPGSPSVLTNMIVAIEQHVEWITRCLDDLGQGGFSVIDTTDDVADGWVAHVNAIADRTLMPSCNSWYVGANVDGKPRVFMPLIGFPDYARICDDVANDGYRGFSRR